MAKRKPKSPIEGHWNIVSMTAWDVEETVEELQPFIEFDRSDGGQFQFGCVYGEMDCRLTERDGKPAAEFSWVGHDEDEQVFGRGWPFLAMVSEIRGCRSTTYRSMHAKYGAIPQRVRIVPLPIRVGDD